LNRRLEPFSIARAEQLTHINTVGVGKLAKRRISGFLIQDSLTRIANVAAAICGGKISFLLSPANRFENLRDLEGSRLLRL
jgi:hypothetical protein